MVGIVREGTFASAERSKKMRFIYLPAPERRRQYNPEQERFGITPRRGGGKARRIPTTARATSSGREKEALEARWRPATNLESPAARRRKDSKTTTASPREATGAPERKIPPRPEPRPPQCAVLPRALPVPRFPRAKKPPSHETRLLEGRKRERQLSLRCVWFGGWHDGERWEGGVRRYWWSGSG
jgi:hypothetical protein